MASLPDRDVLRATLAGFDTRQRKIVGGVIAVMIQNPERVREREWIAEQFTQVALLACGFEDVSNARAGTDQLQGYARANIAPILNACYGLFRCVGADMAARADSGGAGGEFTIEEAVAQALSYMNPPT